MGFPAPRCGECGKPSLRWAKLGIERYLCANAGCGTLILGIDAVDAFRRVSAALAAQRAAPMPMPPPDPADLSADIDAGPHDEKDALWQR